MTINNTRLLPVSGTGRLSEILIDSCHVLSTFWHTELGIALAGSVYFLRYYYVRETIHTILN